MALVLSGSIDISGSMTATTIVVSSPGAAGMVSSSAQITELVPLMQSTSSINNLTGSLITTSSNNVIAIDGLNTYTASIKGAAIVSSSQQIQNYFTFAKTGSANTFYGNQTISGSLNVGSGNTLNIYRTDNTRALQLYTTNDECVINSWEASAEPLHIRSMGAGGRIQFFTSGSEKMRITPDGYQRMATGTKGIQFNGDTAAANALNDYEEGTFTPVIVGGSTAGTCTYTSQTASYTKIGNCVFFRVDVIWTGHNGTGGIQITGLPFTPASNYNTSPSVRFDQSIGANKYLGGHLIVTNPAILIQLNTVGGAVPSDCPITAAGDLRVAGFYYTA